MKKAIKIMRVVILALGALALVVTSTAMLYNHNNNKTYYISP